MSSPQEAEARYQDLYVRITSRMTALHRGQ
jgi:hypothetical protein